ncbi:MAG TPA: hypothetical protein ENJ37_02580 [Deltaproteobacteria bacterium]|nr:hypothetical protein [Deltaproteobacteria bacterium]
MKLTGNDRGAILVTMLVLMVIVSILGVVVINTSTIDIQISRNARSGSLAFGGAEAGTDLAVPIISNTIVNNTLTPSGTTGIITGLDTTNLQSEILGGSDYDSDTPTSSPDVTITDLTSGDPNSTVEVRIDIDRLYSSTISGSALDFASGYEGVGLTISKGGTGILYRVTSRGSVN